MCSTLSGEGRFLEIGIVEDKGSEGLCFEVFGNILAMFHLVVCQGSVMIHDIVTGN